MYLLKFEIPGLPKLLLNGSQGWKGKHFHKRQWKQNVAEVVNGPMRPLEPLTSVKLTCTRFSAREPDRDNLSSSFKAIIDGLVEISVIKDDNSQVIKQIDYRWEKVRANAGKVQIIVEEVA